MHTRVARFLSLWLFTCLFVFEIEMFTVNSEANARRIRSVEECFGNGVVRFLLCLLILLFICLFVCLLRNWLTQDVSSWEREFSTNNAGRNSNRDRCEVYMFYLFTFYCLFFSFSFSTTFLFTETLLFTERRYLLLHVIVVVIVVYL